MAHSSDRNIPPKSCVACGRPITWRRKWARDWENVKFCSAGCRRSGGISAIDQQLEAMILSLLDARAPRATICPSEAARAICPEDWRPLMEPARRAARRLTAAGKTEICQGGRVVDAATVRGPIRIRRRR